MSKQIKISDGLVISRAWLETHICNLQNKGATSREGEVRDFATHDALIAVLKNSTPLAPVVEKAFDEGVQTSGWANMHVSLSQAKQKFLNGKIEIES